ncbi:MAG TPA: hypothetical protein VK196_11590, partial [Magnetospirillum sp.]|nr:hypothetical protein [Magnetospirillum sp.]
MSKKTIGGQFRVIAVLLGTLAIVAGGAGVTALSKLSAEVSRLLDTTARREDILLPAQTAMADARVAIIQVQQYLSDISATRGLNGLNDGFAKAEEQVGRFRASVNKLRDVADKDPELRAAVAPHIAPLADAFNEFAETGRRTA